MGARLRSWWQQIKIHPVRTVLIALLAVVIVLVIFGGYIFNWDWTGFNRPSKTLWDWLQLLGVLAVPVVVGFGAVWFTTQQGKVADAENKDNQRETALQAYIDKMSELLLEKHLSDRGSGDEVRKIARVRTVTVLPHLDGKRKVSVLRFLYESRLIDKDQSIVDLEGANLRGADLGDIHPDDNAQKYLLALAAINVMPILKEVIPGVIPIPGITPAISALSGALEYVQDTFKIFAVKANLRRVDLSRANLVGIILIYANLNQANLSHANLRQANLSHASLVGAFLTEADLTGAHLSGANLSKADLNGIILDEVDLTKVTVTDEQLAKAKSLKGATMPDGSKHP